MTDLSRLYFGATGKWCRLLLLKWSRNAPLGKVKFPLTPPEVAFWEATDPSFGSRGRIVGFSCITQWQSKRGRCRFCYIRRERKWQIRSAIPFESTAVTCFSWRGRSSAATVHRWGARCFPAWCRMPEAGKETG